MANPHDPPKIVAFIPARYGSTRFPGKPVALIAGQPMIQHVYQRARSCPGLSDIFVATDDERIFQCVMDFGGKAIMTGEKHPTGTDRIAEAARILELSNQDVVVNIQGDQPTFHPTAIADLVNPLMEDQSIPMGTLKYRIPDESDLDNPNHVKVVTDKEGFALFFSRYPIPFYRDPGSEKAHYKHIGIYAYRVDFLEKFVRLPQGELESAEKLEQLRALENGFRIKVVETSSDSLEVDIPEDVERVEALIARSNP